MILAERHNPGHPIHNIARLSDGRYLVANIETEGDPEAAFDDPWTGGRMFGHFGRGEPPVWDDPIPLMDLPMSTGTWGGPMTFADRDGNIHLIGVRNLVRAKGSWSDGVPGDVRMDLWHAASRDGGTTWEQPKRVEFGRDYTGAFNSIIQLRSGRIVVPISYLAAERTGGMFVAKVAYSDDAGRTWLHDSTDLPIDVGGRFGESGAIEPVVVERNDGKVWMVIRTQYGIFYESFSDDGRIWSEPEPTSFKASNAPAQVVRLSDGRLVLIWNHSVGPPYRDGYISYARQVLNAAISGDDGKTWHGYREVVRLRPTDAPDDHVRYPMVVEMSDGRLLLSFHCVDVHPRRSWYEYTVFDPDRLNETTDRDDFTSGLDGWSVTGVSGVDTASVEGEMALSLRRGDTSAVGATRNFPYGRRGTVKFELRRGAGASPIDLVLNETFLMPSSRAEPGAINVALDDANAPPGAWLTVSIQWDVAGAEATVRVGERDTRVPITLQPGGISYLTFYGRPGPADEGATFVRRLEMAATA